jgi:hypothetical protein
VFLLEGFFMLSFLRSARKQFGHRKPSRTLTWRARPIVEGLEQRTLLSIMFSGPGNSGVATITGTTAADQFVIQLKSGDNTMIEFSDNGGSTFTDAALAGITAVNVVGMSGNDELVINEANGLVGQTTDLPISFTGATGENILTLEGTASGTITETFTLGTTPGSGTLNTTDGTVSSTVTLTDVGKIHDTMTADTLTINGNGSNDFIHIHNGPVINGFTTDTVQLRNINQTEDNLDDTNQGQGDDRGQGDDNHQGDNQGQGDSQGQNDQHVRGDDNGQGDDEHNDDENMRSTGTSESISFANKTNVVLNGNGGNVLFLVSLGTAADGLQTLTIDGGTGTSVAVIRNSPANITLTLKNVQVVGRDSDAFFIEEMYAERLGRMAGQSEVNFWMNTLQGSGGQQAVVNGIDGSAEAHTGLVKTLYQRYLGRAAVGGEEQGWVRLMLSGATEEQVTAGILGSAEFQARASKLTGSGNASQSYVQALYQLLLNRTASSGEVNYWTNQLPTHGRLNVAMGFLQSNEFRTGAVTSFYTTLLQRSPDATGLASWVNSGNDLGHIRHGFEASSEFFNNG